jgi:anti-sigma factor RsiW
MKHQSFEKWLFDQDGLSQDQARALRMHLESCERCTALETAWIAVRAQIQAAPMQAPSPGFTRRWRSQVALHRYRASQRQVQTIVVSTAVGLVLFSLFFLTWLFPFLQGIAPDISVRVGTLVAVVARLNFVWDILGVLADSLYNAIPLVFRVGLPSAMAALFMLWIASLYRLGYLQVRRE